MVFKVVLTEQAAEDLNEHFELIAEDSHRHADRWLQGAVDVFISLQEMPNRHAAVPESLELGYTVRAVPYHSHRICYRVLESVATVEILRVWHMARRELGEADLT